MIILLTLSVSTSDIISLMLLASPIPCSSIASCNSSLVMYLMRERGTGIHRERQITGGPEKAMPGARI